MLHDDVHGSRRTGASTGTPVEQCRRRRSSADSFRLTQLLGDNTARIIQVVWRVRW